jgi:glycosyltransferase involved in cell wall biosynthesis
MWLPFISVIAPVFGEIARLDPAIRSMRAQLFADWELIIADFGSTGDGAAVLRRWAVEDNRIHIEPFEGQGGVGAARNAALRTARGQFITYLDQDDEYHPDYLAQVRRLADGADVLVFGYDLVYDDAGATISPHPDPLPKGEGRIVSWDPGSVQQSMFSRNIAAPLGMAHRRTLLDTVGGFNEMLWQGEDWDFWKRLARPGAEFVFLPLRSGRKHVPTRSAERAPHPTPRQREAATANWRAGKPVFHGSIPPVRRRKADRIAFVSPHCLIDSTNGPAIAMADTLSWLQQLGFQCQAFCGGRLDRPEGIPLTETLAHQGVTFEAPRPPAGQSGPALIFANHKGVPVTLFPGPLHWSATPDVQEGEAFLAVCGRFLDLWRPDAVLSYGGDPVARALFDLIEARDIPMVFGLHNFNYFVPDVFRTADYVITYTDFLRQYYWNTMGLACHVLPPVLDPGRVETGERAPRYLTFVNPEPRKGLFVFARIAEVLARRRPDIPILLVEAVCRADVLGATGLDVADLKNVTVMPNAPDPRQFFALTKVLLTPALAENFALVAREAMFNGIPVVSSDRGGLPETIGEGGILLGIPARYTEDTCIVPTAEEVSLWIETIVRLWDDAAEYERCSRAARERAQQWRPDRLVPIYREFFSQITHQPGPPLVPLEIVKG